MTLAEYSYDQRGNLSNFLWNQSILYWTSLSTTSDMTGSLVLQSILTLIPSYIFPGRWWFQADNLNDFKSKYAQAYWSINLINISASITQPSYHYIHLHSKYLSKKQKSKLFSSCIQFITEIRKSFLGITKFSI